MKNGTAGIMLYHLDDLVPAPCIEKEIGQASSKLHMQSHLTWAILSQPYIMQRTVLYLI